MQRLLILGKVWPEPTSSAAGSRTLELMNLFGQNGWELLFASPAAANENSASLEIYKAGSKQVKINDSAFDQWMHEIKPDMVLFDRFTTEEQFGWRVHEYCPDALKVLDTIDLHCLRTARQTALKAGRKMQNSDLLQSDTAAREIASIYRCDISLMISQEEMRILREVFKVTPEILHYTPFLPDPANYHRVSEGLSFEERKHFISIGNFLHAPNWDAVQQLKTNIWPLIRKKIPDAELHIYGAYADQKVLALHAPKQGFIIKGRAADAIQVMREAKVCLAPLRFGAGMKGKLLDAMMAGTPSVTTSIGAEAMHDSYNWAGAVCENDSEFSEAAVQLYTNRQEWERARENGHNILSTVFDTATHSKELTEKVTAVKQRLVEHRLENFTGTMLRQQNNAATRYMALWIEEKNKTKNP